MSGILRPNGTLFLVSRVSIPFGKFNSVRPCVEAIRVCIKSSASTHSNIREKMQWAVIFKSMMPIGNDWGSETIRGNLK